MALLQIPREEIETEIGGKKVKFDNQMLSKYKWKAYTPIGKGVNFVFEANTDQRTASLSREEVVERKEVEKVMQEAILDEYITTTHSYPTEKTEKFEMKLGDTIKVGDYGFTLVNVRGAEEEMNSKIVKVSYDEKEKDLKIFAKRGKVEFERIFDEMYDDYEVHIEPIKMTTKKLELELYIFDKETGDMLEETVTWDFGKTYGIPLGSDHNFSIRLPQEPPQFFGSPEILMEIRGPDGEREPYGIDENGTKKLNYISPSLPFGIKNGIEIKCGKIDNVRKSAEVEITCPKEIKKVEEHKDVLVPARTRKVPVEKILYEDYLAKISGQGYMAGLKYLDKNTYIELLAGIRDRYEELTSKRRYEVWTFLEGTEELKNESADYETRKRIPAMRLTLGKKLADWLSTKLEMEAGPESIFRGEVKTSYSKEKGEIEAKLEYETSNLKGKWSRWIQRDTKLEIRLGTPSEELIKKRTGGGVAVSYEEQNNTVILYDLPTGTLTEEDTRGLLSIKGRFQSLLGKERSRKLSANLGLLMGLEEKVEAGYSAGISLEGKRLKIDISTEVTKGLKQHRFVVGYKF